MSELAKGEGASRPLGAMTPLEHFREAERLAYRAASWHDFDGYVMEDAERIARKLADATLALAHAQIGTGTISVGDATRARAGRLLR